VGPVGLTLRASFHIPFRAAAGEWFDRTSRPLPRVPGIGKRGAERMVLELRDKVGPVAATAGAPALNGHGVRGPVVEALVGLGFAAKQAEEATDKVLAERRAGAERQRRRRALRRAATGTGSGARCWSRGRSTGGPAWPRC